MTRSTEKVSSELVGSPLTIKGNKKEVK